MRSGTTITSIVRRAALTRPTRNAAIAYEVTVNGANLIGAGMAASGVGVPAIGVAMCFSSYMLASARQPNMSAKLLPYCILGFALSEALALFTLLIAYFFSAPWLAHRAFLSPFSGLYCNTTLPLPSTLWCGRPPRPSFARYSIGSHRPNRRSTGARSTSCRLATSPGSPGIGTPAPPIPS